MSASPDSLLRIENLSVAYRSRLRSRTVLDQVSLAVHSGQAVGLVGESGCGKSTLALAALNSLPHNGSITNGAVTMGGQDVLSMRGPALRNWWGRDVALVSQDPTGALTPSLTVGAQVSEVCRHVEGVARKQARDLAAELLTQVALTPVETFFDRYPHELSGGQRQRVVLAMALAGRPRLLLLDEPTTGQDAAVESELIELIHRLRGEFIDALLFITHNLELVTRTCDQVNVLYAGRIVEQGPVRQVLDEPAHPYTAALVACVPPLGARADRDRLPQIAGALPSPGEAAAGCRFAPRCPVATSGCLHEEPQLVSLGERSVRCIHPGSADAVSAPSAPAVAAKPPSKGALLELKAVSKRYRGHVACDGVDLTIRRNETLGLVGMSGSGKTTLARIVAGLTKPDTGELRWNGEILAHGIARRPEATVRRLQLVPQHPDSTLNPSHRIRSVLNRAIRRLRGDWPVDELAASVRLEAHHLDSRPGELSGGLRQRVAIARAFAGSPELVICDEPVSSLDVSVQAAVLNLLADLQATRHTSLLFISHDLRVVRYLSHRIAVIYCGQIVEIGPAERVFQPPYHPYTEALVTAARTSVVDAAESVPSDRGPATGGCPFAAQCPYKLGDICDAEAPPPQHIADGHAIRCHIPAAELSVMR